MLHEKQDPCLNIYTDTSQLSPEDKSAPGVFVMFMFMILMLFYTESLHPLMHVLMTCTYAALMDPQITDTIYITFFLTLLPL